jgi:hypothetical protein
VSALKEETMTTSTQTPAAALAEHLRQRGFLAAVEGTDVVVRLSRRRLQPYEVQLVVDEHPDLPVESVRRDPHNPGWIRVVLVHIDA